MTTEEKHVTCGFCTGGCAIIATIEDGKLASVKADKESPRGHLCPRGALAPKIIYGKERITMPLIRTGERGDGKFREASWEEALDHTANLLLKVKDEHGARALASYFGRGVLGTAVFSMSSDDDAFFANLGSPNDANCSSICNTVTSAMAPHMILGVPTSGQLQDVGNSELIISWGKNSATDAGPQQMLKKIKAAQERGARLVVIDPRESGLGEIADWWIPIMPGTDGALANAMAKIILESGRYDKEFVQDWTQGFDEYMQYLKQLSLDELSNICGISIEDINGLVDEFCSTTKCALISYTGLEYSLSAVQAIRAQYVLWAITGKLDVEGGTYITATNAETITAKPFPKDNPPLGEKTPLFYGYLGTAQFSRLPDAVIKGEPYPIRGLVVVGGSPAISFPDGKAWLDAYSKLDALVVVDRFYNEEMRWADVVLPGRTLYEALRVTPTADGPFFKEPVLAPVGESKEDAIIMGLLAEKLGFGSKYPKNEDELKAYILRGNRKDSIRLTLPKKALKKYKKWETGDLRADGKPGFPTPSGKFEICSTELQEAGYTPYPEYVDVRSLPEFADMKKWPLIMTTGARDNKRMGSLGANLSEIGEGIDKTPRVTINEEDAAASGISEGDKVKVTTPFGDAVLTAKVGGMKRGAIHVPHGGGSSYMPQPWQEGAANQLTSLDYYDPISGFVMIKSIPCRIKKLQ